MEQVFPEPPFPHHRLQITMGRGDHADIHGDRLRPTDPLEGLLLEHTQQFDLRAGRQIADFVEEEGALVRLARKIGTFIRQISELMLVLCGGILCVRAENTAAVDELLKLKYAGVNEDHRTLRSTDVALFPRPRRERGP